MNITWTGGERLKKVLEKNLGRSLSPSLFSQKPRPGTRRIEHGRHAGPSNESIEIRTVTRRNNTPTCVMKMLSITTTNANPAPEVITEIGVEIAVHDDRWTDSQ